MTEPSTLMTIGDFARDAGLTPKALRLYDDLGLLPLARIKQVLDLSHAVRAHEIETYWCQVEATRRADATSSPPSSVN